LSAGVERPQRYDVVVLGGGPAGCVVAHTLAGRGVRTLLSNYDMGESRKGEILNSIVRPILGSLGLAGNGTLGLSPVVSGSIVNWGGATRQYSTIASATGPSYLVDRPAFDEDLRSVAKAAGATIVSVRHLPIVTQRGHEWEIKLSTGQECFSVTASLLIDASGRRASIVRRFGQRKNVDHLICIYYLAVGRESSCDHENRWLLAADPNGWWFSVRVGPAERVFYRLVDASDDAGTDWWSAMADLCPELSAVVEAGGYVPKQRRAFSARTSYSIISAPRLAAAGDAAFAVDPLSGQGLALALSQGLMVGSYACEYLGGRPRALAECHAIQRQEFRRMLTDMTAAYSLEPRWRGSRFWAQRTRRADALGAGFHDLEQWETRGRSS
jgi:flavin-dependent dehydrogenase